MRSKGIAYRRAMSLAGVSLRDLEYVVAVADHASFVAAAEHCHVTQPSLSLQIRKVEAWLGGPIFERTSRRVILTATGARFVEQARRVLSEARLLRPSAQSPRLPFGGTLHLSAIATLGPYLFPRILKPLRAHYRDVNFVLGEGLTDALLAGLRGGALDAAFLSPRIDSAGLEVDGLFRESFLLACPADYVVKTSPEKLWRTLPANERLLLEEGHCLRDQALAACSDVGKKDRHGTSLETLKYMVAAGEGCTLVPALAADRGADKRADRGADKGAGIRYFELPSRRFARDIDLVWRRSDARQSAFREFARIIRRFVAKRMPSVVPLGSDGGSNGAPS
jgi:LysR family hydrogen peroxide-inducible transcriptional activator